MHASFQNETRPFLLTAAVTADPKKVDQGYVVPDFCRYVPPDRGDLQALFNFFFLSVISITWAWWPTIIMVMHRLDFRPSFSFSSGAWDNVTGINAPLYGRNDSDDDSYWKNVVRHGTLMVDEGLHMSSLESFHSLLAGQRLSSKKVEPRLSDLRPKFYPSGWFQFSHHRRWYNWRRTR